MKSDLSAEVEIEAEVGKMESEAVVKRLGEDLKLEFYKRSLMLLKESNIGFLVGGAYALYHYTGIFRDTKDLDIFIMPGDYQPTLEIFAAAGFQTSLTFTHWLAKATWNGHLVDIIFNSGNAISEVDNRWFENSVEAEVFGIPVRVIPPEEMIWSKGFIMERERYDGADVSHVLLACGKTLDWNRLLERFGPHWRILLNHLVLFGFIYPSERALIPAWVMRELMSRLDGELEQGSDEHICRGTLLSRSQYKLDVEEWGFRDARLAPCGNMTKKQIRKWDDGALIDGCARC